MQGIPAGRFAGAALAAALAFGVAHAQAQEVRCTTIGAITKCSDGTTFEQAQPGSPNAAAAAEGKPVDDQKPTVTNIGRSGPTRYENQDLRIFGVDDRIRRLGETNSKTGQQDAPVYSGRNCGRFNTSIICD